MERRAYRIVGRVQGVGFRWFTRQAAAELGLRGTVRNAPDGSVEIEAEGPPDTLERFEERLRRGPPAAGVSTVEPRAPSSHDLPRGFEIRR